jgi:type IV pilus assembly protein PilX
MGYFRQPQKWSDVMKKHDGFALVTTLLMLLMITSLGIMTMQVTSIQQKMASTFEDKNLSFTAAETALSEAQDWLLGQSTEPVTFTTCSSYPCLSSGDLRADFTTKSASWWGANSISYSSDLTYVDTRPKYLIVYLQYIPDSPDLGGGPYGGSGTYYYQITSRGTGSSDTTVSMLQTTVARRY